MRRINEEGTPPTREAMLIAELKRELAFVELHEAIVARERLAAAARAAHRSETEPLCAGRRPRRRRAVGINFGAGAPSMQRSG